MWYSFGFVESVQGVRKGDIVWQVIPTLPAQLVGRRLPPLHECAQCCMRACCWLHTSDRCRRSVCTHHTPQIGFGSGFKWNSVVWRALRSVKTVHHVSCLRAWCTNPSRGGCN